MTKRKPRGVSTESWVEAQIREAANRGEFDDLPGAGKPLPAQATGEEWLAGYLRREGVSTEEILPTPLRLLKEIERLPATLSGLRREDRVRELIADLNARIDTWLRSGTGPAVRVTFVDTEAAVAEWRAALPAEPPVAEPVVTVPPRWWHRFFRPR